ncbi:hypothetical protein IAT38_003823 [Cryptococcus sp. DSM 104549]
MPTSQPALPPYITSGASSRAHHALLVRLNDALSPQEEDAVISQYVAEARSALTVKKQSTAKTAEILVILLHCAMIRHRTDDDLEFALVPALQLAEAGGSVAERRVGYLFLAERLPRQHELHLMLINTLRKDLTSTSPSHILLALHTIAKLPSQDLAPAVIPILTSKPLLRHKVPSVRQKVLEAIIGLHVSSASDRGDDSSTFPLSISKITKLLGQEKDPSVFAVCLRALKLLLQTHQFESDIEKEQLVDYLIDTAEGISGVASLEHLRVLGVVIERSPSSPTANDRVAEWLQRRLRKATSSDVWKGAYLFEVCRISKELPAIAAYAVPHITRLLRSPTSPGSSNSPPELPSPNEHVLALRCLSLLPTASWDGALGEGEMGVIMEGVNSSDDTIRRLTVRLLYTLSPPLSEMIFTSYIDALDSSNNLSLPLHLPPNISLEEKLRLGRQETASRALEAAEVTSDDGAALAKQVGRLLEAMELGNNETGVWEEGLRRVLEHVQGQSPSYKSQFTQSLLATLPSSTSITSSAGNTMIVICATLACEFTPSDQAERNRAIESLSAALPSASPSVQEIVLVALVVLVGGVEDVERKDACKKLVDSVRSVGRSASSFLKKRCGQAIIVAENDLFDDVMRQAKSRRLPDVLAAIVATAKEHTKQVSSPYEKSPPSTQLSSEPTVARGLRYDAYEPPRSSRTSYRDHAEDSGDE